MKGSGGSFQSIQQRINGSHKPLFEPNQTGCSNSSSSGSSSCSSSNTMQYQLDQYLNSVKSSALQQLPPSGSMFNVAKLKNSMAVSATSRDIDTNKENVMFQPNRTSKEVHRKSGPYEQRSASSSSTQSSSSQHQGCSLSEIGQQRDFIRQSQVLSRTVNPINHAGYYQRDSQIIGNYEVKFNHIATKYNEGLLNKMAQFKSMDTEQITHKLKEIAIKVKSNHSQVYNYFEEENKIALKYLVSLLYDDLRYSSVIQEDQMREIAQKEAKILGMQDEQIATSIQINNLTTKLTRCSTRFDELRWILEESQRIYEDFTANISNKNLINGAKQLQVTNLLREFQTLRENFDELKIGSTDNSRAHQNSRQQYVQMISKKPQTFDEDYLNSMLDGATGSGASSNTVQSRLSKVHSQGVMVRGGENVLLHSCEGNSNRRSSGIFTKSQRVIKLRDIRAQIESLEGEYRDLDNIQESLEEQVAKYKHCFTEQLKLCSILQHSSEMLEEENRALRTTGPNHIVEQENEKAAQKMMQSTLLKEKDHLAGENAKLSERLGKLHAEAKSARERIQVLEKNGVADKATMERVQATNGELVRELREMQGKVDQQKVADALKETLRKKQKVIDDQLRVNEQLQDKVYVLQQDVEQRTQELSKVQGMCEQAEIKGAKQATRNALDQLAQIIPSLELVLVEEGQEVQQQQQQRDIKMQIEAMLGKPFLLFLERMSNKVAASRQFSADLFIKLQTHCNGRIQGNEDLKVMGQMVLQAQEVLSRHSQIQLPTPLMILREELELKKAAIQDKLNDCSLEQQQICDEFNTIMTAQQLLLGDDERQQQQQQQQSYQQQYQWQTSSCMNSSRVSNVTGTAAGMQSRFSGVGGMSGIDSHSIAPMEVSELHNDKQFESAVLFAPQQQQQQLYQQTPSIFIKTPLNNRFSLNSAAISDALSHQQHKGIHLENPDEFSSYNSCMKHSPPKRGAQQIEAKDDLMLMVLSQASAIEQLLTSTQC